MSSGGVRARLLYRGAPLRLARRWRRVGGLRLHERYREDAAGGAQIVCVHGLGVSSRYLLPTAARLAERHRVYVPDLPGFGHSADPPRALDVRGQADVLEEWLAAAGIDRALFLGNSMGCQVIVDLAARRPQLVERAILVGPTMDARARTLPRQTARLLATGVFEPPGLNVLVAYEYLFVAGPRRTLATAKAALGDPLEEKLPLVAAPTLVVRGSRDLIVPQRWAEEVTRLLPAGRLVVVPAAAHAVNYNSPRELVRIVEAFLGGE